MAVFITGGARSGKSDFAERYAMKLAPRGIYVATSRIWDEETAERVDRHKRLRGSSGYPWTTVEEPRELAALLQRLEAETAGEAGRPSVLIDCLTLWLTNVMLQTEDEPEPGDDRVKSAGEDETASGIAKGKENETGMVKRANDQGSAQTKAGPNGFLAEAVFADSPDADKDLPADRIAAAVDELAAAVADYTGPLLLVTNEVGSGIVPAYPLGRRFRDEAGRMNRRLAAVCEQAFLVVAGFPLDLKTHAFRLEEL